MADETMVGEATPADLPPRQQFMAREAAVADAEAAVADAEAEPSAPAAPRLYDVRTWTRYARAFGWTPALVRGAAARQDWALEDRRSEDEVAAAVESYAVEEVR